MTKCLNVFAYVFNMPTLHNEYEYTMAVKFVLITLFIFLPYICGFVENLFATHSTDKTYQRILRNEHHQEN